AEELLAPGPDVRSRLKETGVPNLRLLCGGSTSGSSPAELLASPQMGLLLDEVRSQADVVVIDTPPGPAVTDAAVLVPRVDQVLLVAGSSMLSAEEVVRAREVLLAAGGALAGVILTKVSQQISRYYGYGAYGVYGRPEPEPILAAPD